MQKKITSEAEVNWDIALEYENCRQLIIDISIIDEVVNQQKNLAVAFHDYQKAYDMVRHNWMTTVYQ